MTTRIEKEKQKAQQEKFQAILSSLLKDDDNKYCVDCDAKGPRWASWNLGIFMCIRCAGIHRNLGVHISKVKSVNLDTWTPEQIAMMMEVGNSRARAAYEANLPDNYRRPQTDSSLESFIRAKYETKKYIAKEWVTPKPTIPRELLEDDKDKKKLKSKSSGGLQLSSVPRSQTSTTSESSASRSVTASKPVQPAQPKVVTPQQPKAPPPSTNTADLIGLDAPSTPVNNNSNNLLGDLVDFMGSGTPVASSQANPQSNTNQVTNGNSDINLFGETTSQTEKSSEKVSTKDSILALYGGQQTQQQQFGVPAVSYMSQCEGMGGVMSTANYVAPTDSGSCAMYTFTDTGYYYGQTPDQGMMFGGVYMPQQQPIAGMYGVPQQMNNMPMQQPPMYGNQMGMMGVQQVNMGAVGANMGSMGMQPQQQQQQPGMVRMPQGNMAGIYAQQPQQQQQPPQQQPQMQHMQFQQMQQQMANMALQGQMGRTQNGIPAGQGWGNQPSGQTLSTNLWQ